MSAEERAEMLGHRGAVVWLTGLSGSGKSTVAQEVVRRLQARDVLAVQLDGDNLREGLCADLGFSAEDRSENIRRAGEVAKLMAQAGVVTLVSFISPFQRDRDRARSAIVPLAFIECHVSAPLGVCEARDVKGLYSRARAGEIEQFTGIDSPYEAPANADLELPTHEISLEQAAERVIEALVQRQIISPATR